MRSIIGVGLACGAALAASPAFAQTSCTRDGLQAAVESYLEAQRTGETTAMNMGHSYRVVENRAPVDLDAAVVSQPLAIRYTNILLDEAQCEAFVEIVALDPAHPYVIGTRLTLDEEGLIAALDSVVTDEGDWLFDARGFHDGVQGEDWSAIPEAQRDTRETLIAAATAYYDRFNDPAVVVPFGDPCHRVEGGARTDSGPDAPSNSCGLGMPEEAGVLQLVERSFLVDPVVGAVVGFSLFGAEGGEPDTHLFRVEGGRIRYVHAITACSDNGCDFGTGNVLGAAPD